MELLQRALERGHLKAGWVAGDDAFGMSPPFRDGLAALGMRYVLDVPGNFTFWPVDPEWTRPAYQGFGRPRKPRLRSGQRRTLAERGAELPEDAWREITVAQGSQGPRTYMFSAQRVRPTSRRRPGEIHWAIWRRNLDGSEPRYYLSNAPEDTTVETLAYVGGSRWRIETEFETEKGDVGLDEYETRSWAGWHHHIAMCLLGGAFLLSLQQEWGKKCPGSPVRRCTGWCVRCCPVSGSGQTSCCGGWSNRSYATSVQAAPTRDAAPPAAKSGRGRHPKAVVVVLVGLADDAGGGTFRMGRWPGERLYTHVAPWMVRSSNAGYCFKVAGWRKCRTMARGLTRLRNPREL